MRNTFPITPTGADFDFFVRMTSVPGSKCERMTPLRMFSCLTIFCKPASGSVRYFGELGGVELGDGERRDKPALRCNLA